MTLTLESVNRDLKTKSEAVVNLLDKFDGETAPTEDQIKTWQDELTGLEGEMKTLNDQKTQLEKRKNLRDAASQIITTIGQPTSQMRFGTGSAAKTIGAAFAESEQFKGWLKSVAPNGMLPTTTNAGRLPDSAPMALEPSIKTILTGLSGWDNPADTSGGALVQPRFRGVVDEGIWQIPLGVADMVTHEPTDADVIFYVKVSNGTAAALTVAEATAEGDTSGQKPQGELTFVQKTALVKTLAIWIPVTRQAMSNSAQLRGVIERYLRYELNRELSRNIIDGDGSGEEFVGIQNLDDVLTQAFSGDIIKTARKAITNLLLNGRTTPSAWCMYPTDAEAYDLEPDNEGRYYFGGPMNAGIPRLWGVPVRQSEFVAQGSPILGDWSRYVVADREQATLRVSDSHASYFTRNMMAILDECRAAGYSERDESFVISSMS